MATEQQVLVEALADLQDGLADQWKILQELQSRPLPDVAGLGRRLEDIADAVERLRPPQVRHGRPWWMTPGLLTVALLVGVVLGWESLHWRVVQTLLFPVTTQQNAPAPARKGK